MAQDTVKALVLTSIASSTVTGTYQPINPNGTEAACFLLRIINDSDESITISYDGINDNEFLLANTFYDIATQTNSQPNARFALFAKYTKVYVKGSAGSGSVYLSGYYV